MGTVSFRNFIRWVPAPASEPTSTLVLSSPGHRFVDLRIFKQDGADEPGYSTQRGGIMSHDRLEWAIAGLSSTDIFEDEQGVRITRSKFHHWIDSRTTEDVTDEGDMYPQDDGTTLEKGRMMNPDTGAEGDYEELWLDKDAPSGAQCVVLKLDGWTKDRRGMVVRLGDYCQGFLRMGEALTVERWERGDGGSDDWKRTVRIGSDALPCSMMLADDAELRVGDELGADEEMWEVLETA